MMGAAYYWWKQLQDERKRHGKEEIISWPRMKKLFLNRFLLSNCSMKLLNGQAGKRRCESVYELEHFDSSTPTNCLIKVPCENTAYDIECVNKQQVLEELCEEKASRQGAMADFVVLCDSEINYASTNSENLKKSESFRDATDGATGHNQLKGKFLELEPLNLVDGYEDKSKIAQVPYKDTDLGMVEKPEEETPIVILPKSIGHQLEGFLKVEGSTNNINKIVLQDDFCLKFVEFKHIPVSVCDIQPYVNPTTDVTLRDGDLSFIYDPGGCWEIDMLKGQKLVKQFVSQIGTRTGNRLRESSHVIDVAWMNGMLICAWWILELHSCAMNGGCVISNNNIVQWWTMSVWRGFLNHIQVGNSRNVQLSRDKTNESYHEIMGKGDRTKA